MTTLDQLGAELRAAAAVGGTRLEDIASWARARRRRRRVGVTTVLILFVGMVAALVPQLLGADGDRTVIDVGAGTSLGSGQAVWPADDVNFSSPEDLGRAFADSVLGGDWSVSAVSESGQNAILLQNGAGLHIPLAARTDGERWFISMGSTTLYLTDDARVGIDLSSAADLGMTTVEILHRPAGATETLRSSADSTAGPWPLPGASSAADVGSVLILGRDARGRVVAVSGGALDGVGTDLEIGSPWTARTPDSLPVPQTALPEGPRADLRFEVSAPIDTLSEALLGQSTDGAWVCTSVRLFREGAAGSSCLPTWMFKQNGIVQGVVGPSTSIRVAVMPFPVTDEQVRAFGRTAAGGYVIVLNRHAVDAGRVRLTSGGRSVELNLPDLGVQPLSSFDAPVDPVLGSGPALWPSDDVTFSAPDELAQAFAADMLGNDWDGEGTETGPGMAGLVFGNGFRDVFAVEALETSGRWVVAHTLGPDLVLSMDGAPTVEVENWNPGADLAWVEVYNRPPGETRTLGGPVQGLDGPWEVPGAATPDEVGSLLVIGRNADGTVIQVMGAATQGVGLDLDLGSPWRSGEVIPPGSDLGPGTDPSQRNWDPGQVLELADGSSLGIIRTVDRGRWMGLYRPRGSLGSSGDDQQ